MKKDLLLSGENNTKKEEEFCEQILLNDGKKYNDEIIKNIYTVEKDIFVLDENIGQTYYYKQIINPDNEETGRYICFCKDCDILRADGKPKVHIANGYLSSRYKIVRTGLLVEKICENLDVDNISTFHIPFQCLYWINTNTHISLFEYNTFLDTFKMILNLKDEIDSIEVGISIIVFNSYNGTRSLKISYSPWYNIVTGNKKYKLRDLFILSNMFHTIKHVKTDIHNITNNMDNFIDIILENSQILKSSIDTYDSMMGIISHSLNSNVEKSAFLGTCDSVNEKDRNLLVLSIIASRFISENFDITTYVKISDLFLSYYKSLISR